MCSSDLFVIGSRRIQEATAITEVQSGDVVATPAAGGLAVRAVAGGDEDPDPDPYDDPAGDEPATESTEENDVPVTADDVLAALSTASPEQLAAHGLARGDTSTTETVQPPTQAAPEVVTEAAPAGEPKTSFLGRLMIEAKVKDASLPVAVVESLTDALPERIVESDVDSQIAALKATLGIAERANLVPTATAQVTQESRDKKRSEERRVGKECELKCRSRWSPYH